MLPRTIISPLILVVASLAPAQSPKPEPEKPARDDSGRFEREQIAKRIDEQALFHRVEDLAQR